MSASQTTAYKQTPSLTPFDTGEVLEPHTGPNGVVDFDNDESATIVQVQATDSKTTDDTTTLQVTGLGGGFIEVIVAGRVVWFGDAETGEAAIR